MKHLEYLRHNGAQGEVAGDGKGSWTVTSENQYKKHDICKKNIVCLRAHHYFSVMTDIKKKKKLLPLAIVSPFTVNSH